MIYTHILCVLSFSNMTFLCASCRAGLWSIDLSDHIVQKAINYINDTTNR